MLLRTSGESAAFVAMAHVGRMQVGLFGDVSEAMLLCAGDKDLQVRDIAKAKRMANGFRGKDAWDEDD